MPSDPSANLDRLYDLLPVVYRQRDGKLGHPLRDYLRVIAEQVAVLEDDIAQLYDDCFIETCQDWVVPYIGDLVGYEAVHAGVFAGGRDRERLRMRALAPRRDVANYIRDLRRRGTLALLENLAADSAGFPSRAVEFYTLLGRTQWLEHVDRRGRVADLRDSEALDLIDSPFDRIAHVAGIRGMHRPRNAGRHNIPSAAVFAWRLRAYRMENAPPAFIQQRSSGFAFYTFSPLGNDAPLFTRAERESDPTSIAEEIHVPAPIRRRALELHRDDYYGPAKSFHLVIDGQPIPPERIVAANLAHWKYRPKENEVAVDPELGRIVLNDEAESIRALYHYGFSDDVGAHPSARTLTQPRGAVLYRVGEHETFTTIRDAVARWRDEAPRDAVIEIADNRIYTEPIELELEARHTLQLRAANRVRPMLRVLDYDASRGERLHVVMHERARFTLDGILLSGRPLRIEGAGERAVEVRVVIRRSTLVPGWELRHDCSPSAPQEASLELENVRGSVAIDRTILGTIAVINETAEAEPLAIALRDSILDATSRELEAISGPNGGYAWATLTIVRTTVHGEVLAHAMELGENAIFEGPVRIVRRQFGCIRFCWVPSGSRTPKRYHCQPDLAVKNVDPTHQPAAERRVAPRFTSRTFGHPAYCQLARDCPPEIARGADDESEMGAFHDLFLPQRAATLAARIERSIPAGMDTGIIYAD